MKPDPNHFQHITGWAIDADPENEPTYPIKKYTGDDHERIEWERPFLQPPTVEVLHSNERPSLSAVFGTSMPPEGLSGAIRRFAFRFSEDSYWHWLPLLLADRINVVEGIVQDFQEGKGPDFLAERGMKAELKYNAPGLAKKVFINTLVVTAVLGILLTRKKARR